MGKKKGVPVEGFQLHHPLLCDLIPLLSPCNSLLSFQVRPADSLLTVYSVEAEGGGLSFFGTSSKTACNL